MALGNIRAVVRYLPVFIPKFPRSPSLKVSKLKQFLRWTSTF